MPIILYSFQAQVAIGMATREAMSHLRAVRGLPMHRGSWAEMAEHLTAAKACIDAIPEILSGETEGSAAGAEAADGGHGAPPARPNTLDPFLQLGPGGDFARAYGTDEDGNVIDAEPIG